MSRVLIGLAATGYRSLYHARHGRQKSSTGMACSLASLGVKNISNAPSAFCWRGKQNDYRPLPVPRLPSSHEKQQQLGSRHNSTYVHINSQMFTYVSKVCTLCGPLLAHSKDPISWQRVWRQRQMSKAVFYLVSVIYNSCSESGKFDI